MFKFDTKYLQIIGQILAVIFVLMTCNSIVKRQTKSLTSKIEALEQKLAEHTEIHADFAAKLVQQSRIINDLQYRQPQQIPQHLSFQSPLPQFNPPPPPAPQPQHAPPQPQPQRRKKPTATHLAPHAAPHATPHPAVSHSTPSHEINNQPRMSAAVITLAATSVPPPHIPRNNRVEEVIDDPVDLDDELAHELSELNEDEVPGDEEVEN